MATITYDGRSFMVDGRRVWLVSGSVPMARIPRELWADRIHAAKLAGCNTVETPVFWNRHEPRPGQFDFTGDKDIRQFVQLVHEAGLFLILRPGPFVGQGWDFGGLPAWLMEHKDVVYRTNNTLFLDACSKYIGAVAEQVRDLQVTSPGKAGPIVLVQNEAGWTCGHEQVASGYLGEVNRYLREAGINVPIVNANNLWAGVEGEIDCWNGTERMISMIRQMAVVRPDQPRLVIDFAPHEMPAWGSEPARAMSESAVQRRLAEILASGGQYNYAGLVEGMNHGFYGGRPSSKAGQFCTATTGSTSPIAVHGTAGPSFGPVRRMNMFASAFGRVLASLDPAYKPVSIDPGHVERAMSIVHQQGSQGGIVWIFGPDPAKQAEGDGERQRVAMLMTPEGGVLRVPMGEASVAWVPLGVLLASRAVLDYATLSVLTFAGRTLVVYGPEGESGLVSINGSPLQVTVPPGRTPLVQQHENITVVCCNPEQVDRVFVHGERVLIGCDSITSKGEPTVLAPTAVMTFDREGVSSARTVRPREARPGGVRVNEWATAGSGEYITGTSPRFATIAGPSQFTHIGTASGYGWYRITIKSSSARRAQVSLPESADRLHVFSNGALSGIWGVAPGASLEPITIALKRGENTIVVLAENLGRAGVGHAIGERKGLYGHVVELEPVKSPKPRIELGDPIEPLKFKAPLWEVGAGDLTAPERLVWTIAHRKKSPLLVTCRSSVRGMLLLGGQPIRFLGGTGLERVRIEPEQIGKGAATLSFAPLADALGQHAALLGNPKLTLDELLAMVSEQVTIEEVSNVLTTDAAWAFARWEPPSPSGFEAVSRSALSRSSTAGPTWWRCRFVPAESDGPAILDLDGMHKGQVYLNGRNVGRYFVQTSEHESVGPDTGVYLPEPWLDPGRTNELLIFDEHGGSPGKINLRTLQQRVVFRA